MSARGATAALPELMLDGLVAVPVTKQRLKALAGRTAEELATKINEIVEGLERVDAWAGGNVQQLLALEDGSAVAVVSYLEVLQIDYRHPVTGQLVRSETPGGLQLTPA